MTNEHNLFSVRYSLLPVALNDSRIIFIIIIIIFNNCYYRLTITKIRYKYMGFNIIKTELLVCDWCNYNAAGRCARIDQVQKKYKVIESRASREKWSLQKSNTRAVILGSARVLRRRHEHPRRIRAAIGFFFFEYRVRRNAKEWSCSHTATNANDVRFGVFRLPLAIAPVFFRNTVKYSQITVHGDENVETQKNAEGS